MLLMAHPAYADEMIAGAAASMTPMGKLVQDNRATILRSYLRSQDSPLADDAQNFVYTADKYNLDWKLVAAIAGVESTFGKHIPKNSYNAWGWGVYTGAQDGVHFSSWYDGIRTVSENLRKNYVDNGAKNIYDVGWTYAANGDSWGSHVTYFMNQITNFTPVDPIALNISI